MHKLYNILPHIFQCLSISIFNFIEYRKRYGGKYKFYLNKYKDNDQLSLKELKNIQKNEFNAFLKHSVKFSRYYQNYPILPLQEIEQLPIVNKEKLRSNISQLATISKSEGIKSKTGGTTGKSLEIVFTKEDMQKRFALLDNFRSKFGYKLGKKTAWFSGKNLLNKGDIKKNRFWKTDYFYNVRYYSTFHVKADYLNYYLLDLIKYKPEYFVGFPSTILELANYGLKNNIDFPVNTVKAIFPTAETITKEMRYKIEKFFKTKIYNQYASSEGAPFIFECIANRLHLELQSGVFEVLDNNNQPCSSGRLIVTSFSTYGTPLIRYDIGDNISMNNEDINCECGNRNPIVNEILGRIDDFIYSPEIGKINLGNVSNTLKDTYGIIKFQAIQDSLNKVSILLEVDTQVYTKKVERQFISNWRDRIGEKMELSLIYVDEIPVEASGKYRIVKNSIKHLIN